MVLVDSNVLIDLFTNDSNWAEWSENALLEAARYDALAINPVIYAEISIAFSDAAKLDAVLEPLEIMRLQLPYRAAFLAGKAFLKYRRQGGDRSSPLPDFFIGAHAVSEKMKLITRDTKRFRSYFPGINCVTP
ncbi:MAG: type II toxin-antitoxin system VapC family toxin [Opitutales bacterium]